MISSEGGGLIPSVLDRLLDEDPRAGDPYLDTLDIKDPAKLARRLRSPGDSMTGFLRDQFRPDEQELVDREEPGVKDLLLALTEGLNRIIKGPLLYERRRFEGVRLSPDTVRLMEESRKTAHVALLNRMLLDEVFADELHKMRKPAPSSVNIRELKKSISRDIEALLNTIHCLFFERRNCRCASQLPASSPALLAADLSAGSGHASVQALSLIRYPA